MGDGAEDLRFESGEVTLAGTFLDPGDAKVAALLISGSGPLDRDSNAKRLRLEVSSAIAATLAGHGVASLRYDKRGTGASGGSYLEAGFEDNYADASAAARLLAERCPDVPRLAIGHSEGALHAARLAAGGNAGGAALISCPARTGEEVLTWQAAQIVPTLPGVTKAMLKALRIDPLRSQQKAFARLRSTTAPTIRVQGKKLNAVWFREFMDYDPVPVFRRITVPVLVLSVSRDMHVPPEDGHAIAGLVAGPCDEEMLDGLSHILRPDPERVGPRGYKKAVREPVSPAVLDAIVRWVDRPAVPDP
jgi:fermentation-respiration switch protein FrsA (DUF1100 family)